MKFIIKKGKHRALPLYWMHWWPLLIKPSEVARRVCFDFSAKYDLGNDDQMDTNKLFGLSFSFSPHKNSARFGWRYDLVSKQFIISAYIYENGKRRIYEICQVLAAKDYDFHLLLDKSQYYFWVRKSESQQVVGAFNIERGKRTLFAYLLGLYFGGNQKAKHRMIVNIRKFKQ